MECLEVDHNMFWTILASKIGSNMGGGGGELIKPDPYKNDTTTPTYQQEYSPLKSNQQDAEGKPTLDNSAKLGAINNSDETEEERIKRIAKQLADTRASQESNPYTFKDFGNDFLSSMKNRNDLVNAAGKDVGLWKR